MSFGCCIYLAVNFTSFFAYNSTMGKIRKKTRVPVRVKIIICMLAIIFCAVGFLMFFQSNINPIIISISEATVKSITSAAVNDAVYNSIKQDLKYGDLIEVQKDSNGRITMLSANAMKINEIARVTSMKAEENLSAVANQVVKIPIGTFTGSPLLSGHGPDIEIKVIPVGAVTSKFLSEFEQAGINQTRHKIYIEIVASVSIVLPVTDNTVLSKTQVLICESILVGDVPEFYFESSGSGGNLDLTP